MLFLFCNCFQFVFVVQARRIWSLGGGGSDFVVQNSHVKVLPNRTILRLTNSARWILTENSKDSVTNSTVCYPENKKTKKGIYNNYAYPGNAYIIIIREGVTCNLLTNTA